VPEKFRRQGLIGDAGPDELPRSQARPGCCDGIISEADARPGRTIERARPALHERPDSGGGRDAKHCRGGDRLGDAEAGDRPVLISAKAPPEDSGRAAYQEAIGANAPRTWSSRLLAGVAPALPKKGAARFWSGFGRRRRRNSREQIVHALGVNGLR